MGLLEQLTIKELTVREISSISMFLWMIHLKSDKNDRLLTKVIHTILKPEENIILSESSLRCRDLFFSITNLAWLCNNYITNGIYKYMHDMFEQSYSTVICNTTNTVAVSCDDVQVQDKVSVMRVNMWIAVFRGSNVEVCDTKSVDKLSQFKLSNGDSCNISRSYCKKYGRLYFFDQDPEYQLVIYSIHYKDLLAMNGQSFTPKGCRYARFVNMNGIKTRRGRNIQDISLNQYALTWSASHGSNKYIYKLSHGEEMDRIEQHHDISIINEEILRQAKIMSISSIKYTNVFAEFCSDKEIIFLVNAKKSDLEASYFIGYKKDALLGSINWLEDKTTKYPESTRHAIVSRDRLLMVRIALQQKACQVIAHVNGRLCVLADTSARHTFSRLDAALHDRAFTASSGWLHVDGRSMMSMWTLAASVDGEGKSTACVRCFTYGVSLKI